MGIEKAYVQFFEGEWRCFRVTGVDEKKKFRWVTMQVVSKEDKIGFTMISKYNRNTESIELRGGVLLTQLEANTPASYIFTFPLYVDVQRYHLKSGEVYIIQKAKDELHAQIRGLRTYRGYVLSACIRKLKRDMEYADDVAYFHSRLLRHL